MSPARRRLLLTTLIGLIGLSSLSTLLAYPQPTCDETTYASTGVSLLQRGVVGLTVLPAGSAYDRDTNSVQFGRLYAAGLAAAFRVLGLSLASARFLSWIGWLAAAGLVWIVGRREWGNGVGLAAALLFATSTKAFLTAHLARPESWLAAVTLLAVWAAIRLTQSESPRALPAFGVGLLALVPAHVHLLGFAFAVGLALAAAVELGLRQGRWKLLALVGLGMMAGAALWWALHIGGDLGGLRQLGAVSLNPLQTTRSGNRWLFNLGTLPDWFHTIFWIAGGPLALVEAAAAVIGLGLAWRGNNTPSRVLALTALGALAAFALIVPTRWVQYGVVWSPFWWLLGVAGLRPVWGWAQSRRPGRLAGWASALGPAAVGAIVIAHILGNGWLVYRYRGSNFEAMGAEIANQIPAGSRVLADPVWWWALQSGRVYMSDEYVKLVEQIYARPVQEFLGLPGLAPEPQAAEALLAKLRPDYVVLDEALGCALDQSAGWLAYRAAVQARCEAVATVAGAWVDDPGKGSLQAGQVSTVYACGP